jgi:hypothetical protein
MATHPDQTTHDLAHIAFALLLRLRPLFRTVLWLPQWQDLFYCSLAGYRPKAEAFS